MASGEEYITFLIIGFRGKELKVKFIVQTADQFMLQRDNVVNFYDIFGCPH